MALHRSLEASVPRNMTSAILLEAEGVPVEYAKLKAEEDEIGWGNWKQDNTWTGTVNVEMSMLPERQDRTTATSRHRPKPINPVG